MLEISCLMTGNQFDNARPQPGGRVQVRRPVTAELVTPLDARRGVHLTRVRLPHHHCQISRCFYCLLTTDFVDLEFEVLGEELAHENGAVEESYGQHAVAERRRQMPSAFDYAHGMVLRHRGRRVARRRRLYGFLDVDQAETAFFCVAFAHTEQDRKAQPPEGAAPFHPVCGIEHFDARVVSARAECRNQPAHFLSRKNPLDLALFLVGKRPESLAQRDRGVRILETFFRKMVPTFA